MSTMTPDGNEAVYRWAVWLLIVASLATMLARIATVCATTGETPMLSANDRSRWCTIRTLVEDHSYVIDRLTKIIHPQSERRYWKSIDMVRHRGWDGKEHYYSSKPTLLPSMLAGEYWVIRAATGATLGEQPFLVMRLMLAVTNVLPLLVYFLVLWQLIDRLTTNRLSTLYAMAAATWGTFLTTFAVTLNNHLVAAICVLLTVALLLPIWWGERRWWYFAGAGLFAAFAAANELPALSFLACIGLAVAWKSVRLTAVAFVPAVALVAAGFFGTNYLAHGTLVPAYAHRSDGPVVAVTDFAPRADTLDRGELDEPLRWIIGKAGIDLSPQAMLLTDQTGQRWGIWDRVGHKRLAVVRTGAQIEIRRWGNWYDYAGSYWKTARQGVDKGEASRGVYAFHVLGGHRGLFSLTPIWVLTLGGVVTLVRRRQEGWALFGCMVIVLTVVCLAFYIGRPTIDRNYGGVCCGFRWMFWFIPLWLLCMVPATDWLLQHRAGRVLALLLLAISIFSATYAAANPWSPSWLFELGTALSWWVY